MGIDSNSAKLGSIKTYLLVGWIFSILAVVGWTLLFLYFFVVLFVFTGLRGFYLGGIAVVFGLIYGIIGLVFMIPSIIVMKRAGRLYNAANRADIPALKANDSVGWAIVALIFTGVIPGIMLLLAHGSIIDLKIKEERDSSILETDVLDKLERLKNLLDTGAITRDEFETQKKKIIGKPQMTGTPEEELKRLKQLFDSGAITKTEYEEQKKQILSKL